MHDAQWNRLHIELAIARARQERAQAVANLFRQVIHAIHNGWVTLFGIQRKNNMIRNELKELEKLQDETWGRWDLEAAKIQWAIECLRKKLR